MLDNHALSRFRPLTNENLVWFLNEINRTLLPGRRRRRIVLRRDEFDYQGAYQTGENRNFTLERIVTQRDGESVTVRMVGPDQTYLVGTIHEHYFAEYVLLPHRLIVRFQHPNRSQTTSIITW